MALNSTTADRIHILYTPIGALYDVIPSRRPHCGHEVCLFPSSRIDRTLVPKPQDGFIVASVLSHYAMDAVHLSAALSIFDENRGGPKNFARTCAEVRGPHLRASPRKSAQGGA